MVEIEKNPLAVRQGATTVLCLAAAAVAMPVISYRAHEQRDGAEWTATSAAFQAELAQQLSQGVEPDARVELTAFRTNDGLRARGSASLFESADARAMIVQAVLRVPRAPSVQNERPEQDINMRERDCLARAIYYEARGETQRGQVAVGEVIMNRVRSGYYPNSICSVVYQGSERVTGCQFTFTCDGSLAHRPRGRAWDRAQRVATAVMLGYTRPLTQQATHYHTTAVNPVWSSGLVETTQIGTHIFYRFPNAAERPQYQAALARRRGVPRARSEASPDVIEDAAADAAAIEAPVVETAAQVRPQPAKDEPVAHTAPSEAPPPAPGEVAT